MYKKVIKWVVITAITIVVVLNVLAMIATYFFEKSADLRSPYLFYRQIVNAALGIPCYKEAGIIVDSPARVNFTTEEWMNIKCTPVKYEKAFNHGSVYFHGHGYDLPENITNDEIRHLNCLGTTVVWEYDDKSEKSVNGELCNNVFTCQVINLAVNDYVLDHPRILKNMLKILERPCDYIKKIGEGSDEKEEGNISYFRSLLRCDGKKHGSWFKKKRIFFILTVWSKDLADSPKNLVLGEFIVRRKDI